MTNGLILRYIIVVTLYSNGHTVYTNVVSAGGGLSVMVTGLGEMHGSKVFWVDIIKIAACDMTYLYMSVCIDTSFKVMRKRHCNPIYCLMSIAILEQCMTLLRLS